VHVDSDASSLHKTETERRRHRSSEAGAGAVSDSSLEDVDLEKDEEEAREGNTIQEIRGGIPDEVDVEKGSPSLQKTKSSRSIRDPDLVSDTPGFLIHCGTNTLKVTWDSPEDPANPKNWSIGRKWAATLIVSAFTLVSPISSSMISPALSSISKEFNITNQVEAQLTLSIFVLAYAVGPLFLGPLSEIYGRVVVLQVANLFYLAWNLACGFAQNSGQLMAFRFMSGLGGSAPLAIGGGLLSDCFHAEQRGKAISIYSLAPLLGPAIGPIAGGFIAENTTWR
jgi:hypothetical protein